MTQRFIGAANQLRQPGMQPGQPFNMGLIDNRFTPGGSRRRIVLPVVTQIHNLRLWRNRRAVTTIGRKIAAVETLIIGQYALNPVTARVEQQFGRIKAVPLRRIPRPMHTVAVEQTRPGGSKPAVPDIARARG